ncbi:hypothetical protein C8A00DRAFT_14837 [Chaetomidium leptoderma]|uniref:Uncharacterized protein n=1 Tax=Chaetomidium leptoderma TaxID=669021 RepID=A0AAN6VMB3_9PEZI|nr:hypothetical protein C8A00DRAFT_14837 [Chaetomidium leptoderma]
MATTARNNVALTVSQWVAAVQNEPSIRSEVKKPGKLHELRVSDCVFDKSASAISHVEYLHLRTVWYRYTNEHIDSFTKLLRNDKGTGYKGFITPEADQLAGKMMTQVSNYLKEYFAEGRKRTTDSGYLYPSPDCGFYAMVRYWQVMVSTHTKDETSLSDAELARESNLLKPQSGSSTKGRPVTPPKQTIVAHQTVSATPATTSHPAVRGTAANRPSADEAYVNTALLLLLQAVTQDFRDELKSLHWVPPRKAMHLEVPYLNNNAKKFEAKVVLEAQVDGYLCNAGGSVHPMAICEAKSFVRRSGQVPTERQETAEMAAWIRSHPGKEGLLQMSASGKKRRLLVSQNRHEIYIIIGEYGQKYEEYIGNKPIQENMTVNEAAAAVSKRGATPPADNLQKTLGSPTFLSHASASGITDTIEGWQTEEKKAATHAKEPPQDPPGSSAPAVPTIEHLGLPRADEFLVMHRFGPWRTDDPGNMAVLIRRLLGLMLQLQGPPKPASQGSAK